jgi:hypothetical protein
VDLFDVKGRVSEAKERHFEIDDHAASSTRSAGRSIGSASGNLFEGREGARLGASQLPRAVPQVS